MKNKLIEKESGIEIWQRRIKCFTIIVLINYIEFNVYKYNI